MNRARLIHKRCLCLIMSYGSFCSVPDGLPVSLGGANVWSLGMGETDLPGASFAARAQRLGGLLPPSAAFPRPLAVWSERYFCWAVRRRPSRWGERNCGAVGDSVKSALMASGLYPDDGVVPCPCSCDRVDTGARVPLEGTRHSLFVASLARRAVRRDVRRNVRVQDGRVDVFAWDPRQDSPCGNRKDRHHGLGRAPNLLRFPSEPKDKLGGDTWRSGGTQES